ncbi:helix-turn-helix domain-containing protein [Ligilactobacillus agilis]|uniref:helix-turn-helix domain-containing protein n=1 Tax=Ligilactobacillus agilis TaxID=1601 RepID=UPI000B5DA002|nr:helix-turn-helix domain-containing protein [Ligilactobacillus agilis]
MTEYLSFKDACKVLGLNSYNSLRAYIKQGLPVIVVGKSKRISKKDLDEFMAKNRKVVK